MYKSSFWEEMVIMNDLEWPMLLYYVIYHEKLKKVMQGTEKVALKLNTMQLVTPAGITVVLWELYMAELNDV